MTKGRVEAFSDGVIAIIITIMVLELKIPHDAAFSALRPIIPVFLAYVLSFLVIGIYWNNHHHMLHATHHVSGSILWANLHLLFWLSLIPFTTAWMGENHFAAAPTSLYGVVLLFCGIAYNILQRRIISRDGMRTEVAQRLQNDRKGIVSLVLYAAAIPLAFVHPAIAGAIYVLVVLMWVVPDKRIEGALQNPV